MREDMIIDTYIPWRSFFAMCMYVCEDVSMHTSAYMLYTCIPCTHILFSLCMCPYIYAKRMEACVLDWVGGRREGTGKAAAGCDGGYAVLKLQTAISRILICGQDFGVNFFGDGNLARKAAAHEKWHRCVVGRCQEPPVCVCVCVCVFV